VDDEKDLLYAFESLLKSKGYENIRAFCDPKEVLKSFTDIVHFKLAILDIRMPDINGIQLYSILKIINPDVKILFMTALDSVNEISLMADIHPNEDIMRKPFGTNQFIQKVTNKIKVL
jgi:DNA-binding response OmpR family regulator